MSLSPTPSLSPQGEAERRALPGLAHRVPVLNGPVLPGTHSPVFIPASLEQHEAGGSLSPRLQPVIILEPSVTHAPLVAGESWVFFSSFLSGINTRESRFSCCY